MNKVIGIVFSDLHIHDFNNFNEGKRRTNIAFQILIDIGLKSQLYKVPVFFCGDMFNTDQSLSNFIINEFTNKFNNSLFKYGLYAITGNHDQADINIEGSKSISYIKSFSRVFSNLYCIDFQSIDINDLVVSGIPYITYNLNFSQYVSAIKTYPNKKNILLIHTDLYGAKDTDGRIVDSVENLPKDLDSLFKGFDLVLSGHIHKPQKLGKNLYMVGATNQLRKSDAGGEFGYWLIYDNMVPKFKPLQYPEFKVYKDGDKTDNFHFWYKAAEKQELQTGKVLDFGTESRAILAERYCKVTGVTDRKKVKELKKVLKNA